MTSVDVHPQSEIRKSERDAGDPARSSEGILAALATHLADDLEAVDALIHRILVSKVGLTNEVAAYVQATSGKRLRPMVTLLASAVAGKQVEARIHAAAVVELLHLASLLHDDVIDRAPLRRGQPTVNARWNNDVAILMADFLYSRAFGSALDVLPPALSAILCRTAAVMCDGEMFQIEKNGQLLSEPDYHFVIQCKTAELFSACARLGGALSGAGDAATEGLARYGREFGCAFQITDDVLDLTADPGRLGKEIGTDIASGKQTLPLIRALAMAHRDDREFLLAALNDGREPAQVIERVNRYGAIEYALAAARDHCRRACAALGQVPAGPPRAFLGDLTDLVLNRSR